MSDARLLELGGRPAECEPCLEELAEIPRSIREGVPITIRAEHRSR